MKARLISALLLTTLIFLFVIPLRQNASAIDAASSLSEEAVTDQAFNIEGDMFWIIVDVLIDYGNGTSRWNLDVMLRSSATALDATLAVAALEYAMHDGNALVTAINKVNNLHPNSWMWWHWNSTGSQWEIGAAACNSYILDDTDIIAWLYEDTTTMPFTPPELPLFLRLGTDKDSYYREENVLATALSVCGRTPVQNDIITAEIDFPNSTIWFMWANSTDADGLAALQFHLPSEIPAGRYSVYASGFRSDLGSTLAEAEFYVLPSNHDLVIMKVEPSTAIMPVGAGVNINITVLNKGEFGETFTLRIFANNTEIGNTSVSLNSEESKSCSFMWTPTAAGSFVISAEIPPVADEIYSADNNLIGGTVTVQKSSIAISIAVSQETIELGKTVAIIGSVAPTETGTIVIQYRLGDDWTTLTTVTTDFSGKYSYVWKPTESGTYQIKARWTGDSSTEPAESGIATVEVQPLIHDIAVSGVVAPTEAVLGDAVTVAVTLSNLGDYNESVSLGVSCDTTIVGNQLFSIASKTSKTVNLSWGIAGLTPGFHNVNVEASVTIDDNIANNKAATSIWIKSLPLLPTTEGTLTVITPSAWWHWVGISLVAVCLIAVVIFFVRRRK